MTEDEVVSVLDFARSVKRRHGKNTDSVYLLALMLARALACDVCGGDGMTAEETVCKECAEARHGAFLFFNQLKKR